MKNTNLTFLNLDPKWINWFVGFADAEGNFQVYPKKRTLKSGEIIRYNVGYGFHLSLHSRDQEVIKNIYKNLNNVGTINISSSKSEVRLAVNDRAGLLLVCSLFDNYPLRTFSQLSRYLFLREGLNNNIKEFKTLELYNQYKSECMLSITEQLKSAKKPEMNLVDNAGIDNWIVGFINGEGCFYLRDGRHNFIIEHTDRDALELIKFRLSFGPNVSERSVRSKSTGGERKVTYQLAISSKKDISCLIDFLDSPNVLPLQGNKYNQYIEWKESKC